MNKEIALYVEPESFGDERSPEEMTLYAVLQGWRSTPDQIDKPADQRLLKEVQKAKEESAPEEPAPVQVPVVASPVAKSASSTTRRPVLIYGLTITDCILLLIAVLLFLNIITR